LDNLTHSLFGLTLARTPLSRAGRGTTAALVLASNAPDIDVVVTLGGAAKYLELHRGPTHGPLGVVVLSFVVALAVRGWQWWRDRDASEPPAHFLTLWALGIVGIVGHVLMDLPTSYGTRALSPFSWTWFTLDWMPIVDIYLLAILGGALWFSRWPHGGAEQLRRRRRNATIALLLMATNYGVRAASHDTAIARAAEVFGNRLPAACGTGAAGGEVAYWPKESAAGQREGAGDAPRCLVELAAMPDFVSPFRWRLIAQLSNGYEIRDVDLLSANQLQSGEALAVRKMSVRFPNQWTPAVMAAATAPTARVFLGFSRFPAARSLVAEDGTATVHWSDLRFVQGAFDDRRQFRSGLFTATVVLAPDGSIVSDTLGRER
jgi:membrane-bound metal-dependent hydrolase YbcI (DUF457 family)